MVTVHQLDEGISEPRVKLWLEFVVWLPPLPQQPVQTDPHSAAHNLDRRAGGEKSVFIHVTFFPVIDLYSARVLSDDGRRRFVSER